HRRREQRAVRVRRAADAYIRRPCFCAEEVEWRANVELPPARTSHQSQIECRAARMAGAFRNIAFLEEVALVDVGIEFVLSLHVVDPLRPAHEMCDRALRS